MHTELGPPMVIQPLGNTASARSVRSVFPFPWRCTTATMVRMHNLPESYVVDTVLYS